MALRIQTPSVESNWLYQDRGENDRYFTKKVILGKNEPEWAECTNEEKEQWEKEHSQPEPENNEQQIEEEQQ